MTDLARATIDWVSRNYVFACERVVGDSVFVYFSDRVQDREPQHWTWDQDEIEVFPSGEGMYVKRKGFVPVEMGFIVRNDDNLYMIPYADVSKDVRERIREESGPYVMKP